jgi:hypothetical protein
MGFIAALLLTVMPEPCAFWTLVCVLNRPKYGLRGYFVTGMPRMASTFYQYEVRSHGAPNLKMNACPPLFLTRAQPHIPPVSCIFDSGTWRSGCPR